MININGYYMVIIWLVMVNNYIWLVVDLPLWKKIVKWDDEIPNIWKNIICSKPPTK